MTGRFAVGDRVRVRRTAEPETINPRTPSYAKGVAGTIIATYGVIANPLDHHQPYLPLYTLRFQGSDFASRDASHVVIAEIHEEWLEPA
jgi:hypothetical protein